MIGLLGVICLYAPRKTVRREKPLTLVRELKGILLHPRAFGLVLGLLLGTLWLIDRATHWARQLDYFWGYAFGIAGLVFAASLVRQARAAESGEANTTRLTEGPMFGALMEMLSRPYILPVILFVLTFKLGDAAMGFMVKPFWVDAGFSSVQIGLVSVNIGLILSIAGGLTGGWFTDRVGIFKALWILGLFQACQSRLCVGGVGDPAALPGSVLPPSTWR